MQAMVKLQFANDPAIANELVKFLSLNSEFDKVKQLEITNSELKVELKTAQKDIKEAVKSVQTMSNKLDQYKTSVEALTKRLNNFDNKNNNNTSNKRAKKKDGDPDWLVAMNSVSGFDIKTITNESFVRNEIKESPSSQADKKISSRINHASYGETSVR